MWPRCHIAAQQNNNRLSSLLPRKIESWLPVLEDTSSSGAFEAKLAQMHARLEADREWLYLSMDATLKLCMKIKGQESYRRPKKARNSAPFGDDVAWRRLLTVRGRSGAVLLMHPLRSEKSEFVADALRESFSESQLAMVEYVSSDMPSSKFFQELKEICPNLRAMSLDPIHLAIVYEYAHWGKKTKGSKLLRKVLAKINAVDTAALQAHADPCYTGSTSRPLTPAEEEVRERIISNSMQVVDAQQILQSIDSNVPFQRRLEFIENIAALCCLFRAEVSRKVTGANKEVFKVLWSACAPDRLEWLFNNSRIRHVFPAQFLPLLASGTSSNEALHAEINAWSRTFTAIHRSTLALKLRFFSYIKLFAHHLATCFPMSHVVTESILLARASQKSLWTDAEWQDFSGQQITTDGEGQQKSKLPLAEARKKEQDLVRRWAVKRPAAKHGPAKNRKRTPLTVARSHSLRSAGVKPSKAKAAAKAGV